MRKVDRSKYKEYMEYAEGCSANRVYPLSIASETQDGDIFTDDKSCVLFRHYCGFAYICGDPGSHVLEDIYQQFFVSETARRFVLITDSDLWQEAGKTAALRRSHFQVLSVRKKSI